MWCLSAKERERDRRSAGPPSASPTWQNEAQVGWGLGDRQSMELGHRVKGKSRLRTMLGSQSWRPGSHFHVSQPPPAKKHMAALCRPVLQTWFLRGRSAKVKRALPCCSLPSVKAHLEFPPVLPPRLQRITGVCQNGTYFTLSCHETSFLIPGVTKFTLLRSASVMQDLGCTRYAFLSKTSHPYM